MQAHAQKASKAVAEAENVLRSVTDQKQPDYAGFEPLLEKFRWSSQDYLFLTLPSPTAKTVEDRLWDGHLRVHKKFQKHLRQFRDGPGKKRHVERRKAEKHYLAFVKASMQFYRGFIGRLASHFQNVPDVRLIANKLHLDTLSVDVAVEADAECRRLLTSLCYSALMRLGDLSRYRETEMQVKERNWGPAKGHYQLAISLNPESGAAFNQLAVMALVDEDHLRAVYYLHRASAAGKPFPMAPGNLKLEFEKILKMKPQEASAISDMSNETLGVLENRFLEFHANCHTRPTEFLTYQEKSLQILQLVQVGFEEIKDRSLDKTIQKMCLINIAAEHLAWRGTSHDNLRVIGVSEKKLEEEHQRNCQAFYLLQRFNIESFLALLKILARELDTSMMKPTTDDQKVEQEIAASSVKRLLPHLRQYSSWLLSNIKALLEPRHPSTRKCSERLWRAYIQTLNMLLKAYPVREIPEINHLLEEDEDTLAFAPFSEKVAGWRYQTEIGEVKPPFSSDLLARRPVTDETRFRARELVVDALRLSNAQADLDIEWSPINLGPTGFEYQTKPEVETAPEPVKTPSQPFRIRAHMYTKSASETPSSAPLPAKANYVNGDRIEQSQGQQTTNDVAMASMVDELVNAPPKKISQPQSQPQPQPPSSFNPSSVLTGTPRPQSAAISVTDLVGRMLQRPNSSHAPHDSMGRPNNPALASIFATPFTPRPEETASLSPRLASAFLSSSPTASAQQFQQSLLQQEYEIQGKTSPLQRQSFTSPVYPQSPRRVSGLGQVSNNFSGSWASPSNRSPIQQTRQLPQAALFGAIGEPRRSGSRTPMSGQSS